MVPPGDSSADHHLATRAPWSEPTRLGAAWHSLKVAGHIVLRALRNLASGPRRLAPQASLLDAPVIAEHRSALWVDGRADEFILRCGKVQNLRVAVRAFDGVVVAPGQVLSFWAQVGWPSRLRGFAVGREVVNGCVVPTVGGGLCQLSNALAALATSIGAQLVERHRHSALIEQQRPLVEDATVAWNYVDLRIVARFAFRIEAELTADELVLRARALQAVPPLVPPLVPPPVPLLAPRRALPPVRDDRPVARGCLTCDQSSCFRHRPAPQPKAGRIAVLLNDRSPELARWLEGYGADAAARADWMVPWVRPGLRARAWVAPAAARVHTARWPSWRRMVRQRLHTGGEGGRRQALRLQAAADLARHCARRLSAEHTELVVAQELLVPLWRLGVLGGRVFDVHAPELPAAEIQRRLDAAALARPDASSLADFRVDVAWQDDEWRALKRARRILTAHHDVFRVLQAAGLPAELLPWDEPQSERIRTSTPPRRLRLTLAGSALARKGAHEVAAVARALGAQVDILGSPPADAAVWQSVDWAAVGYAGDWLSASDVVLLPAFVEHQPRALLRALAAGVPVVASPACGLCHRPGLTLVEPGDSASLLAAVQAAVHGRPRVND
ncbi:VanW family protein [Ideonella sp. DXS29W]|uniref:VanW family protein n=1 Tax=Ideonella lacteola TaxID=2984193 RepID=A0ABU9BXZ2_9BURK